MPNFPVKAEMMVLIYSLIVQATTVIEMKESVVDRYMECATVDMYRNNCIEIRCLC